MQALREERTDNHRISDDSLLAHPLTRVVCSLELPVQFKELDDLSSLELFKPFLHGEIPLEVFHYRHTFVE